MGRLTSAEFIFFSLDERFRFEYDISFIESEMIQGTYKSLCNIFYGKVLKHFKVRYDVIFNFLLI